MENTTKCLLNRLKTIYDEVCMKESLLHVLVSGTSMYPTLLQTDIAIVIKCENYPIGSILVFLYDSEGYIIHRLLRIIDGWYYCKGDNSFRLEMVKKEYIIGRVVFVKRDGLIFTPTLRDEKFIEMSLQINSEFVNLEYNRKKVMESKIYCEYKNLYLKKE